MKTGFYTLLAAAVIGLPLHGAMATEITVTSVQLNTIISNETKVANLMSTLATEEAKLAASTQLSVTSQDEAEIITLLNELVTDETYVLEDYQAVKATNLVALQQELISETKLVLSTNQTLDTFFIDLGVAPEVLPQPEKADVLNILAAEHNTASVLVQKDLLLLSSLPADVTVQAELQLSAWDKIITSTQTIENTPIQ